jgi:hypothetical protein
MEERSASKTCSLTQEASLALQGKDLFKKFEISLYNFEIFLK